MDFILIVAILNCVLIFISLLAIKQRSLIECSTHSLYLFISLFVLILIVVMVDFACMCAEMAYLQRLTKMNSPPPCYSLADSF